MREQKSNGARLYTAAHGMTYCLFKKHARQCYSIYKGDKKVSDLECNG